MSLANDTDLWMFIASGGGLTAGRVDADGALFPYQTVDRLHDAHYHTGPITLFQVETPDGDVVLWEPFNPAGADNAAVERNLYKNINGSRLTFEEIHHDLDLTFRYSWSGCDEFGWVKTSKLENGSTCAVRTFLLDGFRNVLPYGAPLSLYQQSSTLVDAYKKSESDPETGLGIFSLTAGITDRAEAVEVLRANTVWCCGLEAFRVHLSTEAIDAFRNGRVISEEGVLNGVRGNYLVSSSLELEPGATASWHLVGDTGRDHAEIAALRHNILQDANLPDRIMASLAAAGENLRRNVAGADGIQLTGRPESWAHHFANVLFNNMRGGVFAKNYDIPVSDLTAFLRSRNAPVAERQEALLAKQPPVVTLDELMGLARKSGDPDFERLCLEYLPLHFGRRHGDPSRPWNRFSIRVRDREGRQALNYEGNWRDIFQNWEALCFSFPGYLANVVAKFVNASTVDGYNPYRLTRDGVDWEVVSPDDPWSNIGYWGDHQIIYLLKLLESLDRHDPSAIGAMLGADIFSYAEVPYLIKPYAEILKDQQSTIIFDDARQARIEARVAEVGSDGKLLTDPDGSVYHANLFEKLLVPALAKLSNLIPDAGIWMNTQRPEWNDANNALGGGGVSVVTLCYLRRYLHFLAARLEKQAGTSFFLSGEVAEWFGRIATILTNERDLLDADETSPHDRKRVMDLLGGAFSEYRARVYSNGFSGRVPVSVQRAVAFCRTALEFVDSSIAANRRADGLYHTYNLLEFADDDRGVAVGHLQEMLEGQVAVLSSGLLGPAEALEVLDRLYRSPMYRPDQNSFMLYPDHELPGFLDKNVVPEAEAVKIPLLRDMLAAGNPALVVRDADRIIRFHGDFGKAADLAAVLDDLGRQTPWSEAVTRDRDAILGLFEEVFHHKSYTGRSGVMYGYEGLGCIYWHMVAKLLLAVQEMIQRAEREDTPPAVRDKLVAMYFRVRSGIGYERSVAEYGAFPTDPYSHTPPGRGAKQPGMTGQVKEEILTRFGELGVRVKAGTLDFDPVLLQSEELLEGTQAFTYFDIEGQTRTIPLFPRSLAFTFCQVPVIYEPVADQGWIHVTFADGSMTALSETAIDAEVSAEIFARTGRVERIRVGVPEDKIL